MSDIESAAELREIAVRSGINELMRQCTQTQIAFIHRIHDSAPWRGLKNCPANRLDETYELLRRTVLSKGDDHAG
jgi:hypothetical protein